MTKLNICFIIFVSMIAVRSLAEAMLKRGLKGYRNKKGKGYPSLFIFIAAYVSSVLATGYFLYSAAERLSGICIAGFVLLAASYAGRVISFRTLGKCYSQFMEPVEGAHLVKSGLYSVVRNPLYLFYILEMCAFVIINFNFISVLMLLITILTSIYRLEKEEILLYNKFREEYCEYKRSTKKLIPFIY